MNGLASLDVLLDKLMRVPRDVALKIHPRIESATKHFPPTIASLPDFFYAVSEVHMRVHFALDPIEQAHAREAIWKLTGWQLLTGWHSRPDLLYRKYFELQLDGGRLGFLHWYFGHSTEYAEQVLAESHVSTFAMQYRLLCVSDQLRLQEVYADRIGDMFIPGTLVRYSCDFPEEVRKHWRLIARFRSRLAAAGLSS